MWVYSHAYNFYILCVIRWSLIAGRIPGRTDNEIKNYWNTHLRKKLLSQGIDPQTHKPLDANNTHKPREEVSGGQNLLEPNSSSHTDDTTVNSGNEATKITFSVFGGEDNEDFGFCYDDKFSSFLNALINDDPFDSNIPLSQPFRTQDCTGEIVGTSSSLEHGQRIEDIWFDRSWCLLYLPCLKKCVLMWFQRSVYICVLSCFVAICVITK